MENSEGFRRSDVHTLRCMIKRSSPLSRSKSTLSSLHVANSPSSSIVAVGHRARSLQGALMSKDKVLRAILMLRRNFKLSSWHHRPAVCPIYLIGTRRTLFSVQRLDRSACIAIMSRSDVIGEGLGTKYGRWYVSPPIVHVTAPI